MFKQYHTYFCFTQKGNDKIWGFQLHQLFQIDHSTEDYGYIKRNKYGMNIMSVNDPLES